MSKTLAFKPDTKSVKLIEQMYSCLNQGGQRIVEALPYLRQSCLKSIKGVFTKDELKLLVNYGDQFVKYHFFPKTLLFEMLKANKDDCVILFDKIMQLKPGQYYFLLDWCNCFHTAKKEYKLDKYVEELI